MQYVTRYSQVKNTSFRNFAREGALSLLAQQVHLPGSTLSLRGARIQFLYFHHVFQDELPGLRNLLDRLACNYSFISYTEAVTRLVSGCIDRAYVAFSSDDGFKCNLDALELFKEYGVKTCFFLNPDTIGLTDPEQIRSFCKDRLRMPPVEFMSWEDVEVLLKAGHEIGSHSMGHLDMANVDNQVLEESIGKSREILMTKCGEIHHFAYPYGQFRNFSKYAFDQVFRYGYRSCASAERGCHVAAGELDFRDVLIRRDHVKFAWNPSHILYFMLRNARNKSSENNFPGPLL